MPPTSTAPAEWIATARQHPRDGQLVWWLNSDGTVTAGVIRGRLWFFADGQMYVYYTPTFWKPRE